jgi:hypothetical protein
VEQLMKPVDVPAELVDLTDAVPVGAAILRSERAAIIAAVLPAHEAMVRAKVAAELHNAYGWSDSSDRHFAVAVVNGGLARGERT